MVPLVHYRDTLPFKGATGFYKNAKILFKPMRKIDVLNRHCNLWVNFNVYARKNPIKSFKAF